MNFRTEVFSEPVQQKISCCDPTLLIGSCFSASIGDRLKAGYFPVLINPFGTVYNPVSVLTTLKRITSNQKYDKNELYNNKGIWLSFDHHTEFSSDDRDLTLGRINEELEKSAAFISTAKNLFITLGTARIYRFKSTGRIVSNCHKIPANEFSNELLSPGAIVSEWKSFLPELYLKYPGVRVVFTISPVRHWKDGAHNNQLSKATLLLALTELRDLFPRAGYFPAYEIFMDDLRDYRFYADDLLHPSDAGIEYVWEKFSLTFFDNDTRQIWQEAEKISRAVEHRLSGTDKAGIVRFAEGMLTKISRMELLMPHADFSNAKEYFHTLL